MGGDTVQAKPGVHQAALFSPLVPGGGSLASGKQAARWILAVWKVGTGAVCQS